MTAKVLRDLKKYIVTSSIKTADIETLAKYRPGALKEADEEGNDKFAVSYNPGHGSVAAFGVTFGTSTTEGGYAAIVGDLPETEPEGGYAAWLADKVGGALEHINAFEASIPAAAAEVNGARNALIASIAVE